MNKCLLAGILLFELNVASFPQTKPSGKKDESIDWSYSWIIKKPDASNLPSILF